VEEIAKYCDEHDIEEIAITEHVKRELTYDFDKLLSDIEQANKRFKVNILTGVEAKILPDGTLDCPEQIKDKVDIIIGSVHSLKGMTEQEAYEKLAGSDCMIIGHPQFFNEKIIASLLETGKIVELSIRYEQSDEMIMAFKDAGLLFSIGLDSHMLEDLDDFRKLAELIERLGLQERLWRFTL
jgi:histidinol phosphatase-like PHP family hydrolase